MTSRTETIPDLPSSTSFVAHLENMGSFKNMRSGLEQEVCVCYRLTRPWV